MVWKINEMQAFVWLMKDTVMWQLDKFQVRADGVVFVIRKGQEDLVAYRFAIRIGSFTRLHRVHISSRQNNPPPYRTELLETPGQNGLRAIRCGKRSLKYGAGRHFILLCQFLSVGHQTVIYTLCRISNSEKSRFWPVYFFMIRFGRACLASAASLFSRSLTLRAGHDRKDL